MFHLIQNSKIVPALPPAADAAGRTSRYVSLKHAAKAFVLVSIDQANAATVKVELMQAKTVAGGNAKSLNVELPLYVQQDVVASDALPRQAPAASFTTSAALKQKLIVFEVPATALDLAGGFKAIAVKTGASNVANITQATIVLVDARYQGENQPSAIVD